MTRLLLELAEELRRHREAQTAQAGVIPSGRPLRPGKGDRDDSDSGAACREIDDFFRKTKRRLPDVFGPGGDIIRLDDSLMSGYIDTAVVFGDGVEIRFKGGISFMHE